MKAREPHSVPIHPALARELRKALHGRERVPAPQEIVVGLPKKKAYDAFKRAARKAGLPSLRWHDMRHGFASFLAQTAPWAVVQRLLGHKPQGATGIYVHTTLDASLKALNTLPDFFQPPAPQAAPEASNA
jgi:integrase